MPTNVTYNVRIDKRVKQEADALYKSMGMSLSTAINLFLTQSVIQGKLPIAEIIAEPVNSSLAANNASHAEQPAPKGTATGIKAPEAIKAADAIDIYSMLKPYLIGPFTNFDDKYSYVAYDTSKMDREMLERVEIIIADRNATEVSSTRWIFNDNKTRLEERMF